MKRLLKIVGYTCLGLFGLLVLAFIALQLISNEQYKKWLVSAAHSATGRELAIDGPFELEIGPRLGLLARDVRFANAPWGTRGDMATIGTLIVELRLMPLFKGVLDVSVEADAPDILLERNEAGQGNWVFVETEPEPPAEMVAEKPGEQGGSFFLPVKPYIRNLEIKDFNFLFKNGAGDGDLQAEVGHLRVFVDGSDIPLTLKATYRGTPIELRGSLGRIDAWHENRQTPISLTGRLNDANLAINGTAGPMLPNPTAHLDCTLAAGNISTFSQLAGITLPDLQGLDLGLRIVAESGQLSAENISMGLADPRLTVAIRGQVADLLGVGGIDLNTELSTDRGNELLAGFDLQIPYSLPPALHFKAAVQGGGESLSVRNLELQINDQGLDISLSGALENLLSRSGGQAALSIDLESTALVAQYLGRDLPAFGPFHTEARFSSTGQNMQLESLQIALTDPAINATISGLARSIGRAEDGSIEVSGIDLSAEVQSSRLDDVAEKLGLDLTVPLPASLSIKGSASGSLDQLAVTAAEALVEDEGLDVTLKASVDDVMNLSGVAANLSAEVADTAVLSKFAGMDLPGFGSLNLQANVVSEGRTYRLDKLELLLDGELLKAQLAAVVDDLLDLAEVTERREVLGTAGIDISLKVDTPSIKSLAGLAGVTLPNVGALKLDGHLASAGQALALDSFNAVVTRDGLETTAAATIADVAALSGVQTVIKGKLDSLAELAELTGTDLPETGPWGVQFKVASDNPLSSPITLAALLEGEGIKAVFNASVADIKLPQTFETDLTIEAESLARVGALLGREVPEDKPLKVTGNAVGKPGDYRVNELLVETGESTILADLAYVIPPEERAGRKKLSGQVALRNLDFNSWLASPNKTAGPTAEVMGSSDAAEPETTKQKETTGKKFFSSEPLSTGFLQDYDVDLRLDAANITMPQGIALDAAVVINLDQGLLRVDPFSIKQSQGGTGSGALMLDARFPTAKLEARLDFKDIVPPRFGGLLDLNLDFAGKGESIADLMGNLNGHFIASLEDMELEKSFMSNFGAGLLSQLNPLNSDTTVFECAVVRFDITDGIADFNKKIAAQTHEVTWLGGGEINLKTEELDLGVSPKARGTLSSLTNIDLASLVHVGGTLAEPRIGLDVADVAKKYGEYTAFIATGGLSFLAQKAFETTQANMDQCELIVAEFNDEDQDGDEEVK